MRRRSKQRRPANPTRNTPTEDAPATRPWIVWTICLALAISVAAIYGQTLGHKFVNIDDPTYVCENPYVRQGLRLEKIAWAMTANHAENWHPLTWISHMLDCQLFGMRAWGHHLTNLLLHAANAVLLFLALWRMTGDLWPSVFVAAVFAVHPLRVESVAWVSERKDVLSGLFFMLTLATYTGYVRHPFSLARYAALLIVFALGLMAKPMLVTLPCVLLLLDYWPLKRLSPLRAPTRSVGRGDGQGVGAFSGERRFWFLLLEKIPLFVLVAASCVATRIAQTKAMMSLEAIPMSARIANALVAAVAYLGQLIYPVGLAVFYPHPGGNIAAWKVSGAAMVLIGLTAAVLYDWRRVPFLPVGWFWYLGMLVPVIGLVQVGAHAMADRYTYLPQIGVLVAAAWLMAQWVGADARRRWLCGAASALIVLILMGCSMRQTTFWSDSETLWRRDLACTPGSIMAYNNLGIALIGQGRDEEAAEMFRKQIEMKPNMENAHYMLGVAMAGLGRYDEAIAHYEDALKIKPDFPDVFAKYGDALIAQGRANEGAAMYRRALDLEPNHGPALAGLAGLLADAGRTDDAIEHYRRALEVKSDLPDVRANLGAALADAGRFDEAMQEYRKVFEIAPNHVDAHYNMANALAALGRLDAAAEEYRKVIELQPDSADARNNLAATLAQQGRYDEAAQTAQKAAELADQQGNKPLAEAIRAREKLYRSGIAPRKPANRSEKDQ